MSEPRKDFWVHCANCKNAWHVATIPMELGRFCEKMDAAIKAGCPVCDGRKILVGKPKDDDSVSGLFQLFFGLDESQAAALVGSTGTLGLGGGAAHGAS